MYQELKKEISLILWIIFQSLAMQNSVNTLRIRGPDKQRSNADPRRWEQILPDGAGPRPSQRHQPIVSSLQCRQNSPPSLRSARESPPCACDFLWDKMRGAAFEQTPRVQSTGTLSRWERTPCRAMQHVPAEPTPAAHVTAEHVATSAAPIFLLPSFYTSLHLLLVAQISAKLWKQDRGAVSWHLKCLLKKQIKTTKTNLKTHTSIGQPK